MKNIKRCLGIRIKITFKDAELNTSLERRRVNDVGLWAGLEPGSVLLGPGGQDIL